jgi:hypothetical protein
MALAGQIPRYPEKGSYNNYFDSGFRHSMDKPVKTNKSCLKKASRSNVQILIEKKIDYEKDQHSDMHFLSRFSFSIFSAFKSQNNRNKKTAIKA